VILDRKLGVAGKRRGRFLVVFAHPQRESLMGSALDEIVKGLEAGGHEVKVIDLYADDFNPAMSLAMWRRYLEPASTKPEIAAYVASLQWATDLVLVYPTWFGAQPAILKGWFDQVWAPGVAFDPPPPQSSRPSKFSLRTLSQLRPRLQNIRSLTVVAAHGSAKVMNIVQGEPGKRVALRGWRSLCHWRCQTRWIAFYGNDQATSADRTAFIDRVRQVFQPEAR
jgi:NAD(P)H dehydrogenase (quinone)